MAGKGLKKRKYFLLAFEQKNLFQRMQEAFKLGQHERGRVYFSPCAINHVPPS